MEKLTDQDELKSFFPNQLPNHVNSESKSAEEYRKTTLEPKFGRVGVPVTVLENELGESSKEKDSNATLTLKTIEEILNNTTQRPIKKVDVDE